MNTKTTLFLDKKIARPFAYLLNFIVRLVGMIASIDHNLDKDFRTIAICKFKGMGSIVQSTPMIAALRNKYPNAEIIYVSTKANEALLKRIKLIDTIVLVDDSSFFRFIKTNISSLLFLIRKRPQVYLDLEIYSDYSTLFTTFTLSKNRMGFYLRSSTFRMGIYTHMMFFNTDVPISDAYLQQAKILGIQRAEEELYDFSKDLIYNSDLDNYFVVNPNASDLRLERRWSKQKYIELISNLLEKYPNYKIVLIGSKGEATYTNEISSNFKNDRILDMSGKTSLDELLGVISNAKLMITNDTGPMHLAFSMKIPVVCFFGPCSPEQYGIADKAYPIYRRIYCSPCVHDFETSPCKGNNVCMKLISVDDAISTINFAMKGEGGNLEINTKPIYSYDDLALGLVNR